jgi:hypothetical protein
MASPGWTAALRAALRTLRIIGFVQQWDYRKRRQSHFKKSMGFYLIPVRFDSISPLGWQSGATDAKNKI